MTMIQITYPRFSKSLGMSLTVSKVKMHVHRRACSTIARTPSNVDAREIHSQFKQKLHLVTVVKRYVTKSNKNLEINGRPQRNEWENVIYLSIKSVTSLPLSCQEHFLKVSLKPDEPNLRYHKNGVKKLGSVSCLPL